MRRSKKPPSKTSHSKSRHRKPSKSKSNSYDCECISDDDGKSESNEDWQSVSSSEDYSDEYRGERQKETKFGSQNSDSSYNSMPCGCCPRTGTSSEVQNLPESQPTCYPMLDAKMPYWEREIVKYDPEGKWDPKVKEKGETGRPNLKNEKNESRNKRKGLNKKKKNSDDKNDQESIKPIVIGQPDNAYKCYKDLSLPCGLAYCTLKSLTRSALPPCPQIFPTKSQRIMICQDSQPPQQMKLPIGNDYHQSQSSQASPPFPQSQERQKTHQSKNTNEWIQVIPECNENFIKTKVNWECGRSKKPKN